MAKVSWMWKGKRYYGTLIRETKTHKFARTKNGKIKKIKKKMISLKEFMQEILIGQEMIDVTRKS
tara:strand:- start:899 stop:1093 length:195 start_codon:yes stop_codon:yes gene_type:complete